MGSMSDDRDLTGLMKGLEGNAEAGVGVGAAVGGGARTGEELVERGCVGARAGAW